MEGFLQNMGLIDMPNIQDYWSTAWTVQVPFFSFILSRERFQLIFWLFHMGHAESDALTRSRHFGTTTG